MASFIRQLADYVSANTALTFGTDLYVSQQPTSADVETCVTFVDSVGGRPTVEAQRKPEYPAVEVVSRSASYETAMSNAGLVYDALHGIIAVEVGTTALGKTVVMTCEAQDTPKSVGLDENGLHEVLVVFQFMTR